jgi:peptidoglycan/LPS O-acetylase OafA/YrhL
VFRSGNFAVTIFLVAAGYFTYVSLAAHGIQRMRPGVTFLRRLLRVGPSLWLMLAVVLVVSTLDSSDQTDKQDNIDSVLHVLTYTWNWYVQENLITSRPDFGHLWYLSVDMQAFVIMAVLLFLLRRRPIATLFALGGLLVVLTWWRFHVTDTEFIFRVLVRTTARMDPFVVGVMLGAALPYLRRLAIPDRALRITATTTLAALIPLMWYCSRDGRFLGWGVTMLEIDLAILFGAISLARRQPGVARILATPAATFLGRYSLLLYIWHYPVFVFVERHTQDWGWPARTFVGLLATALVSLISYQLVERRASEFLRRPGWRKLDDGIPSYAHSEIRRRANHFISSSHRDPSP